MTFLDRLLLLLFAVILLGGAFFIESNPQFSTKEIAAQQNQSSAPSQSTAATSTPLTMVATSSVSATSTSQKKTVASTISAANKTSIMTKESTQTTIVSADPNLVNRIENPYSSPPESFATINDDVRGALVNILCSPHSGTLRPISGSGVIIDPRGVILTNAHVAQYVLLSESENIDLSCVIRTGSPAIARWHAEILYIPPVWVDEHAQEITAQYATGTGEHDYALLLITDTLDGQRAATYPFIPVDTRQAIGFEGDSILAASYPAEFLGGLAAQNSLYAVSSVATIQKLLTFVQQTVDLLSLGGIPEAQSGSSGGAVVNQWGRLIGIIVTTSAGDTTGERDLRALALSYIDRDIAAQTGNDLSEILGADVTYLAADFNKNISPTLTQKYIDILASKTRS